MSPAVAPAIAMQRTMRTFRGIELSLVFGSRLKAVMA